MTKQSYMVSLSLALIHLQKDTNLIPDFWTTLCKMTVLDTLNIKLYLSQIESQGGRQGSRLHYQMPGCWSYYFVRLILLSSVLIMVQCFATSSTALTQGVVTSATYFTVFFKICFEKLFDINKAFRYFSGIQRSKIVNPSDWDNFPCKNRRTLDKAL